MRMMQRFPLAIKQNLMSLNYNTMTIDRNSGGKQSKMNVHYDKTYCTLLGTRHSTQNSHENNIYIGGYKIANVTKQKLLGIYIDENLQWSDHIDNLCSTISSKISLLKQLSLYIPVEVQKHYYQGCILPLIDYGSSTWGTTSKANIEGISKLQKRAAQIILNAPFDTASAEMFNILGWQTVTQRHNYSKAVLLLLCHNYIIAHLDLRQTPL